MARSKRLQMRSRTSKVSSTPSSSSPSALFPIVRGTTVSPSAPNMRTHAVNAGGDEDLFNNEQLSDVTVKFSGQQLFAHKAVLARKSKYFYRAFTGKFPVASSNEIDLGDDETPEAIIAMIRYIYDLPYDKVLEGKPVDDTSAYITKDDLPFHIAVFTAADKYDVCTLRPLIVKRFEELMEATWKGKQFAADIQKLIGPSAGVSADNTLRAAAAAFCAKNLTELVKEDSFVKMIQKEEPFTGRLLTDLLGTKESDSITLKRCTAPSCHNKAEKDVSYHKFLKCCVHCGGDGSYEVYENHGYHRGLENYKRAVLYKL
ncbi:hypothetical protein D6C86_04964 [Aureobasidium pullulans]|nr:hypothetical protein D6C86_04964 [Aureobasidium pullulans]